MKYKVTFATSIKSVEVEAKNEQEAKARAWSAWDDGEGEPFIKEIKDITINPCGHPGCSPEICGDNIPF